MDIFTKKNSGRLTKDNSKIVELDGQYSLDIYGSTITLRNQFLVQKNTKKTMFLPRTTNNIVLIVVRNLLSTSIGKAKNNQYIFPSH